MAPSRRGPSVQTPRAERGRGRREGAPVALGSCLKRGQGTCLPLCLCPCAPARPTWPGRGGQGQSWGAARGKWRAPGRGAAVQCFVGVSAPWPGHCRVSSGRAEERVSQAPRPARPPLPPPEPLAFSGPDARAWEGGPPPRAAASALAPALRWRAAGDAGPRVRVQPGPAPRVRVSPGPPRASASPPAPRARAGSVRGHPAAAVSTTSRAPGARRRRRVSSSVRRRGHRGGACHAPGRAERLSATSAPGRDEAGARGGGGGTEPAITGRASSATTTSSSPTSFSASSLRRTVTTCSR